MKKFHLIILTSLIAFPSFSRAQEQIVNTDTGNTATQSSCLELMKNMGYRARDASTSGEVSVLQKFLKIKGYLNSEPTGFFGSATLSAVKKFQSASSIPSTGYVGQRTRSEINVVSCSNGAFPMSAITQPATTTLQNSTTTPVVLTDKTKKILVDGPVRISIPKIEVDALVESVGLTPDGIMDSPVGPAEAGWYNLGPKPGEKGSAVIDGHSGWKNNIPAIFDNLHKLNKGDSIYVQDEKGIITTFVVVDIKKYDPTADASEVFLSTDSKARLNLITCGGVWDKITRSSSKRLVVFAEKE